VRTLLLAAATLLVAVAVASAAESVTLPGAPLSVSVGPLGQCQSSYAGLGNDLYPPTGALGDCGFFLGFPESGNPPFLQKKVFGFKGVRGPGLVLQYTALGQGPVTGAGTSSDPYRQVTTFAVGDPTKTTEGDYALIEETTSYVDGEAQFESTYDVENVTGQPEAELPVAGLSPAPAAPFGFHAVYAGDLSPGGSDSGAGVLVAGPPRLLGGQDETAGTLGGFVEAPPPSPPWSSYASGCWNVVPEAEGRCPSTSASDRGIWASVRAADDEAPVFDDVIDPNAIDDGAGVSWDNHLGKPLQPGEHAVYSIVDRAEVPTTLSVAPTTQTRTVGQTTTISVTAHDTAGVPYAERPLVYTIGSANPKTGSVLTSSTGVATISYTGTVAGADTIQMFLDLASTGVQASGDPAATASVTWTPPASSASGSFRIKGVHVGAGGVVTIVIVPAQQGIAKVQVSAPTVDLLHAAKRTQTPCARGKLRIGRRCLPKTTVTGSSSAAGSSGASLRLTVRGSSTLIRALRLGKRVHLTAKLSYRSALGGTTTVHRFALLARGAAPRRRH
jgi:hypothetical protein